MNRCRVAPGSPGGQDRVASHEALYSYVYAMPRGSSKSWASAWTPAAPAGGDANRLENVRPGRRWAWSASRTGPKTCWPERSVVIGRET